MDNCCGLGGYKCKEGEGDCDTDSDCFGDLKCGDGNGFENNCDTSLGFPGTHDCCYDPSKGKRKISHSYQHWWSG